MSTTTDLLHVTLARLDRLEAKVDELTELVAARGPRQRLRDRNHELLRAYLADPGVTYEDLAAVEGTTVQSIGLRLHRAARAEGLTEALSARTRAASRKGGRASAARRWGDDPATSAAISA